MLILMFASICIFFVTNLSVTLYKIIAAQTTHITEVAVKIRTIVTGLGWFQSLNYAVIIFIDCLIIDYLFILILNKFLYSLS